MLRHAEKVVLAVTDFLGLGESQPKVEGGVDLSALSGRGLELLNAVPHAVPLDEMSEEEKVDLMRDMYEAQQDLIR